MQNEYLISPLMLAVSLGSKEIVELLLEKGADPNQRAIYDATALIGAACIPNSQEIMAALLEHGADINAVRTSDGYTPLAAAVAEDRAENVRFLLEQGADPYIKNNFNQNAIELAYQYGWSVQEVFAEYLQQETNKEPNNDDVFTTEFLNGLLQLDHAKVREYINKGANPNMTFTNDSNEITPLMYAAENKDLSLVQYLISVGADVNARDSWNSTALHRAVARNSAELVNYLLDKGADIEARTHVDLSGGYVEWTPLMLAVDWGYQEMVELLLARGADPNAKTCIRTYEPGDPIVADNITALTMAEEQGKATIAKTLKDAGAR